MTVHICTTADHARQRYPMCNIEQRVAFRSATCTALPKDFAADCGGEFRVAAENFRQEMSGTEKGNIVHNIHVGYAMQNRVMAVFESSAAVFELPQAATLEDLAGRLAHLSEGHDGTLISVDVGVGLRRAKTKPSLMSLGAGWPR